jgi:hypothetical protein
MTGDRTVSAAARLRRFAKTEDFRAEQVHTAKHHLQSERAVIGRVVRELREGARHNAAGNGAARSCDAALGYGSPRIVIRRDERRDDVGL